MKPFFVHTHLGIDLAFWNNLISSHKRIQSNFDIENLKTYVNSNIEDLKPQRNKWYFSRARWFDIILHNYQVGYKQFYQDFKHVVIFGSSKVAEKNINEERYFDRLFCKNYISMRFERLKYICQKSAMPLVIVEGLNATDGIKQQLCDFLEIPFEYENFAEKQASYDHNDELSDFLIDLHERNKILLSVQ
jgi:hypothetical protein